MPTRKPTARVWIAGYPMPFPNVPGAISLGEAIGQPVGGGSIRIVKPPFDPEIKMPVVVEWGFDWQHVYAFHGFVVNPQRAAYPRAWNVQVKNILWLADFPVMKESINLLNNKTANNVMEILLHGYAGIPLSRIQLPEFEQSPGVPWLLGTMTPIEFSGSPLQGCIQICDALGYALYADASGVVRARKISGAPSDSPLVYWDASRDWLVQGAPNTDSDGEKIFTRVVVTGAATNIITGPSGEQRAVNVRDVRQIDNHPLLPNGQHREMGYSNGLVEYTNEEQTGEASAEAIATRLLLEHSRTPYTVTARVKAQPGLEIGTTIAAREPRIGLNAYRPFFLMSVQTTFGGGQFDANVTLDGGVGEAGFTTIPDPIAAFVWMLHKETLNGTDYVEVFLDGTASRGFGDAPTYDENGDLQEPVDPTDPTSTIQSWIWSDDSVPPQSGEGPRTMFKYPADQTTARICLTVTDVTGKVGTTCINVAIQGDVGAEPTKRELSLAAGASWYVTPDGGKTWRRENAQYTEAVPPISALGSIAADIEDAVAVGLLSAGNSDGGGLRATSDYLASPSVTINAGGATPAKFIWQHERYPERIWMAIGEQAFLSADAGVLFYPRGNFGAEVRWIVESIDTVGVVDVLAGADVYTSWDAQTDAPHWTKTLEGPPGSVARNYVSGFGKHWVGYETVPPGSSPLRSIEGDEAVFASADPPVTSVRALTMMVNSPDLIAIDSEGRIWRLEASTGTDAVHIATMP